MARQPGLPDAQGPLPAGLRLPPEESEAEDLRPAERERLRFHLEQFVNATSPTLLLLSNPAALRRAMETGGASIADGAAQPPERPQGGPAHHGRRHGVRAGAQPRHHAGQGGLPQPADRADPVRAADRAGPRGAAAVHPALDQQVLHPRHAAEEQLRALPGRAGLHGLRHQLEEPRRLDGGASPSRTTCATGRLAAADGDRGDHRQPDGEPGRLLHRRHARSP